MLKHKLMSAVVMLVLLTACGGNDVPTATPPPPTAAPTATPRVVLTFDLESDAPLDAAGLASASAILGQRLQAAGVAGKVTATDKSLQLGLYRSLRDEQRDTLGQLLQGGELRAFDPQGRTFNESDAVDLELLGATVIFSSADLITASVTLTNPNGYEAIDLQLQGAAVQRLAEYSRNHVGQQLPLALDDRILFAPTIQSELPEGKVQISFGAGGNNLRAVYAVLRFGPLPTNFTVASEQVVP